MFLKNVPKTAHFYWGGQRMSYLRYLTIETFKHYNPDWQVWYHYPRREVRGHSWHSNEQRYGSNWHSWMNMVSEHADKLVEVPWDEPQYRSMSEVHRSDYYRLKLLSTVGGLWVDMDILFIKPIDNLAINIPENADKKTVMCIFTYGHSIGFMMASEENKAFKKLEILAMRDYNPQIYQCMGAELYNKTYPNIQSVPDGVELGMDAVYYYNCTQIKHIFGNPQFSPEVIPHCIGVHWYAGSQMAGQFLARTHGGEQPDDSLLGKLIKDYERNLHKDI